MDGFLLAYDGFDPGAEGLREALTSTGNGYLCVRGAAEWEDADGVHYPGTYAHGGYNRETTILGGPVTFTLVDGAPHASNVTHPNEVNRAILGFMSGLDAG